MHASAFPIPMQFTHESFVVTWSPSQDAFDVATVGEMLRTNIGIFANGRKGDFVVLGIAPTHAEAAALSDMLQSKRNERLLQQSESEPRTRDLF